jgi:hypothetical protein
MKTLAILLGVAFLAMTTTTSAQNAERAQIGPITLEQAVLVNIQNVIESGRIVANLSYDNSWEESSEEDVWLEPLQLAANIPTVKPSGMMAIPLHLVAKESIFTYGLESCDGNVSPLESANLDLLKQDARFKIASSFVWIDSTEIPDMVRDGTAIPITAEQAANPKETLEQLARAARSIVTLNPDESALASAE